MIVIFQQLNGLVGLTEKEIELLSENPPTSQGYLSSSSDSTSVFRDSYRNPLNRPSSLPGQRIAKVPLSRRSRTPMFLPSSSNYKPIHEGSGLPANRPSSRTSRHHSSGDEDTRHISDVTSNMNDRNNEQGKPQLLCWRTG